MRVGKTWGWSAWRYCIELVTFLKNVLRPHRTLIKASDLASQIAVSNSPYDRSISSFRVSQLQGLGSPFSVTLPPSLSVPRDPWLQLSLLYAIPPFWHREGVPRVPPDHNPPPACLNLSNAQDHIQARESNQGRFLRATKNCMIHTGALGEQSVGLLCQFLLKLPIKNWLNNLKKNRCSSVNTKASNCYLEGSICTNTSWDKTSP